MAGVALFDLDSTLIDVNSGKLWVAHEWREGRVRVRDAAWASWILFRYSLGHAELDQAFMDAVASLPERSSETSRRAISSPKGPSPRPPSPDPSQSATAVDPG